MTKPYFEAFTDRKPPFFAPISPGRRMAWHFLAGSSVAAATSYLYWRWTQALNPEAWMFSVVVALAETLFFLGSLLFYFDIWDEGDTQPGTVSDVTDTLAVSGDHVTVDVLITTCDEPLDVVRPSLEAAVAVDVPQNVRLRLFLLDDGNRPDMAEEAAHRGIGYFARQDNAGFKAGNLRHALLRTSGDFFVICDADTRLLPTFLEHTLGYFADPKVAWVQTPHWFYDLPEGETWAQWLQRKFGWLLRGSFSKGTRGVKLGAQAISWISGRSHVGHDPFRSDPSIFFDVIQRRRNRHNASFCCGAASIHRREAVFAAAIAKKAKDVDKLAAQSGLSAAQCAATLPLQPYRFHVSEDLYTSILVHEDGSAGWRSVYHPQVEAKMLSPWSLSAWAAQRLKYAGGTFDIAVWDNPLWRSGLSWRQKLHYGATFWSYLSGLWAPVLLLAPVVSLVTGLAPVAAYSGEFFQRFLPAVVLSELAVMVACKRYGVSAGRILAVLGLPIQMRALYCVLRRRKPQFAPTPKLPGQQQESTLRYIWPHVVMMSAMTGAAGFGIWHTAIGTPGFSAALLWVNLFWLFVNMTILMRAVQMARWSPPSQLADLAPQNTVSYSPLEVGHVSKNQPV